MQALSILLSLSDSTYIKSFSEHLLNGVDSELFKACVIAGYVGYIIYFLWTIEYRDVNTTHSPKQWDWNYFWRNNLFSLIRDAITLPVVILFYPQILDLLISIGEYFDIVPVWLGKVFETYNTTTVFTSIAVGFAFKYSAHKLRAYKWRKKAKKSGEASGNA